MNITTQQIKKVAQLARLAVDEKRLTGLQHDLNNIIQLVEQMSTADTSGIEALAHPFDETQPLRDDVVTENDQRPCFQALAPLVDNNLYLVPEVISSEE